MEGNSCGLIYGTTLAVGWRGCKKPREKLSQDSHSPSLDLNLGSPEYKKEC